MKTLLAISQIVASATLNGLFYLNSGNDCAALIGMCLVLIVALLVNALNDDIRT